MIQAPRGTKDVLPKDVYKWQYVEGIIRDVCKDFNYKEIRVPTFEYTELFARGVGATTDIVQKEMYTFKDKKGRSLTLRPEGTAGVVRAYLEHKLYGELQPIKVYYIISTFRYEKPQLGREREFTQFGVEVFGAQSASVDAEIISLAMEVYRRLGVTDLKVCINSIGCPNCRKEYNEELKKFIRGNINNFCETCIERFDKNPLRILDCKEEKCKELTKDAPKTIDYLCEECKLHFEELKENLKSTEIDFEINPFIVRGLDYYTKTVFEIISNEIGAQSTVCGGGRYDGLVEELGGKPTPGVGFGMGIERLLLTLENKNIEIPKPQDLDLFVVTVGENAQKKAKTILKNLRSNNISCDMDHLDRSLKAQMKYADKINARYCLVLGDDEINSNKAVVKSMFDNKKIEVNLDDIVNQMRKLK